MKVIEGKEKQFMPVSLVMEDVEDLKIMRSLLKTEDFDLSREWRKIDKILDRYI